MCMRTRWNSPTGLDVLAKYAPMSRWERALHSIELASKIWRWKCQKPKLNNAFVYYKKTSNFNVPQVIKTLQEGLWRRHKVSLASPTLEVTKTLGTTFNWAEFMIKNIIDLGCLVQKATTPHSTNTSPLFSSNINNQHILTISSVNT